MFDNNNPISNTTNFSNNKHSDNINNIKSIDKRTLGHSHSDYSLLDSFNKSTKQTKDDRAFASQFTIDTLNSDFLYDKPEILLHDNKQVNEKKKSTREN